jgi:hypothetical protein
MKILLFFSDPSSISTHTCNSESRPTRIAKQKANEKLSLLVNSHHYLSSPRVKERETANFGSTCENPNEDFFASAVQGLSKALGGKENVLPEENKKRNPNLVEMDTKLRERRFESNSEKYIHRVIKLHK